MIRQFDVQEQSCYINQLMSRLQVNESYLAAAAPGGNIMLSEEGFSLLSSAFIPCVSVGTYLVFEEVVSCDETRRCLVRPLAEVSPGCLADQVNQRDEV
jgi:hypothetical protein